MAKTLTQIFLEHGQPSSEWDDAKKAAFKRDMDEYEASILAAAPRLTPTKKEDGTAVATIDPALQAQIDAMNAQMKSVVEALQSVTRFVQSTQDDKAAQAKAARETQYKAHVEKLASEGRIDAKQKDAWLQAEAVEKNVTALEIFVETTSTLPVRAEFKGRQERQPQQQQQATPTHQKSIDALRAEAAQELAQSHERI